MDKVPFCPSRCGRFVKLRHNLEVLALQGRLVSPPEYHGATLFRCRARPAAGSTGERETQESGLR